MSDIPILFSAPMVRAQLAGAKWETRRILKEQPPLGSGTSAVSVLRHPEGRPSYRAHEWRSMHNVYLGDIKVPYQVGDRLWVRETLKRGPHSWYYAAGEEPVTLPDGDRRIPEMIAWAHHKQGDTCVSIHMPRWASRLTWLVTHVAVERVKSITAQSAIAEGATMRPACTGFRDADPGWSMDWSEVGKPSRWASEGGVLAARDVALCDPRLAFGNLWEKINGPESWNLNPWVVAVTARVVPANIDTVAK